MSCCSELKKNEVWACADCGLEVKIVKECDCLTEAAKACKPSECLSCCDKPLTLKK